MKGISTVNILASATSVWLMNDALVMKPLRNRVQIADFFFFFNTYSFKDLTGKSLVEFLKCCLLTTVYRVLHFLLMSSCLGQTKQMFGLEAGFIWRDGRKYWEICYWHLIPDISVDWKNIFFLYFSLFFPFLLLAWIYVKWTEFIIDIWQGSWKHTVLFLTILTVFTHKSQSPDSSDHSEMIFFLQVFKTWN